MAQATSAAPSVFRKLTFTDIVLKLEETNLFSASSSQPLRLETKYVQVAYTLHEEMVAYEITYSLQVVDSVGQCIWTTKCAFMLLFKAEEPVTEEEAAGDVPTLLGIAHPHLTQHIHQRTLIMGLPPLVLEIYSPARDT